MTECFQPGDLGWLSIELVAGPLDGQRYGDIPMLPAGAPDSISIPLGKDPKTAARAAYRRRDEVPGPDGAWLYDYAPEDPSSTETTAAQASTTSD
ncbi:hypothetical protein [Cellulomonas bogoriensis]|uniref:Uncharacterized protein n=1 Tax=Cellulomonas bogoriensis 69B4 = DSM 16987 TaxID=1386082 RepID=A0A0A0C4Z6_9CELL|nr:hypothetical protein [Cellulomonas bogoriensis]KGM14444.1 hypothetical protein N869_11035 [Cellulomonas bogoriensis 69B4 = DSM 16987]